MNTVQIRAPAIRVSEQEPNDIYMSVAMRMFSTRPNSNGFAVTESFIDRVVENAAKYVCIPLCADTGRLKQGRMDALGHMQDHETGTFGTEQIGSFFAFAKVSDEYGVSLIGEARIPKRDGAVCGTLLRMYAEGKLNFSFEILAEQIEERDGLQVIDAAEGNEQIGMAVVSIPAYPEAKALKMVAEEEEALPPKDESGKEDAEMEETQKKIAELETKLRLAEQKNENDEELRRVQDDLEEARRKGEQSETARQETEVQLEAARANVGELENRLAEAQTAAAQKDVRIAELEAQVAELVPYKAEAEMLKAEKAEAEMATKRAELLAYVQAQGLDATRSEVTAAIEATDYAAVVAQVLAAQKNKLESKPAVASYAMTSGVMAQQPYGDLLEKA